MAKNNPQLNRYAHAVVTLKTGRMKKHLLKDSLGECFVPSELGYLSEHCVSSGLSWYLGNLFN